MIEIFHALCVRWFNNSPVADLEIPLTIQRSKLPEPLGERESNFGLAIYTQLACWESTNSVDDQLVEPGPRVLGPMEASAVLGPIASAEKSGIR